MKNNFICYLIHVYVAIKKFKVARIAHVTFLLGSAVLESYI